HRFCIDQIARHRREHILLNGHLFLYRPLHTLEADAELIFEQLTDRANATIAEMVDIVLAEMFAVKFHPEEIIDNLNKIAGSEKRIVDPVAFGSSHLDVELQPADT